jgi:hypothetical protein
VNKVAQPTIIPSEGVDPYTFSNVNVGTGIGKALKKGATTALKMRNIKAQHNVDMLKTKDVKDGKVIKTGALPELTTTKAAVDEEIDRQENKDPSKPKIVPSRTKEKVGRALVRSSGALSKVQAETFQPPFKGGAAAGKAAVKVAKAAETVSVSAAGAVAAARKKAKQVRPKKETSLSTKRL